MVHLLDGSASVLRWFSCGHSCNVVEACRLLGSGAGGSRWAFCRVAGPGAANPTSLYKVITNPVDFINYFTALQTILNCKLILKREHAPGGALLGHQEHEGPQRVKAVAVELRPSPSVRGAGHAQALRRRRRRRQGEETEGRRRRGQTGGEPGERHVRCSQQP